MYRGDIIFYSVAAFILLVVSAVMLTLAFAETGPISLPLPEIQPITAETDSSWIRTINQISVDSYNDFRMIFGAFGGLLAFAVVSFVIAGLVIEQPFKKVAS